MCIFLKIDNNRMRKNKVKLYLVHVKQYLVNAHGFKFQHLVFLQLTAPLELRNQLTTLLCM
jgi:hypothetical protein